jgi:hypothetical protein
LAEFWMIEPEVAFNDLNDNMDLAEDFIKYVIKFTVEKCADDLKFLEGRLLDEEKQKPQAERSEMTLLEKLNFVLENNFKRVSYTEAIDILKDSTPNKKKKFQFPIEAWGTDLQSEHERFLVEKHFKCPVIIYDYPAKIKAFYMRLNTDTEPGKETVRAMDILFPGIGEIVGGSQREERYDVLVEKMKALGTDFFGADNADDLPFAKEDEFVTTLIDGNDYVQAKMDAMAAHLTQIALDGPFFALSNNIGLQVWGNEYYTLVKGDRSGQFDEMGRETDLFAGISFK